MLTALIIAGSVIAALALIAFAVWAHQYTKVGPNEVLIISGRRGYRIVRGGGTFVRPFRERVQRLSLELMQFEVRTADTYTAHGVPVQINGVCMIRIDPATEGIERAAQQFLSRHPEEIMRTAMQAVEGHMRAAVGSASIEEIYRERQRLVAAVRELAGPDLDRMGLQIVSLTVRDIADKQGYLDALGRPRTAQVKRDAIRGEAEAEREAKAARFEADLAIEASRRDYEVQRAGFKAEGRRVAAEADLAYDLQRATTMIELVQAEVERRRRELEAEVVEPALARAREILAVAEAERQQTAALGAGEADALRLKGLAEAETMAAKARSFADYNEAAVTDRFLEVLPALAAAVSAPLAKTDRIVMIGGNGASGGASGITKDVAQIVAELPAVLESLTGMKLEELVKRVPSMRSDEADGSAEEIG
jgi:flotillin